MEKIYPIGKVENKNIMVAVCGGVSFNALLPSVPLSLEHA